MAGIRIINHLVSLLTLRLDIIHPLNELTAHALTQVYVPVFLELRDGWDVIQKEEIEIRDKQCACNASLCSLQVSLNALIRRTSNVIRNLTGDTKKQFYVAFFKKRSVSETQRLPLAERLALTRGWIEELKGSGVPAMVEVGTDIEACVGAIDSTIKTRDKLSVDMAWFRDTGNRKKFVDKVNEKRTQTHTDLSAMPHQHVGLPRDFADLFFRRDTSGDEKPPTLDSVNTALAKLEHEKAEQLALREELEKERENEAKEEEKKAANQAAIAELDKEEAALAQRMAEIASERAELSA